MLLPCPLCCQSNFKDVHSLRRTLINAATAPLTCPVCHEILKGLDKLTIHLLGHVDNHCNSDSAKQKENVVISGPEISYSNNVEDECDKNKFGPSVLPGQQLTQECSPVVKKYLKQPEIQTKEDDLITCDICSFTFTDKNILDMHHQLLHQTTPDEKTGIYSYHCHLCSKRFRMRGSLMVHLRVAHYGFSNQIDYRPHLHNDSGNSFDVFEENKEMYKIASDKSLAKPQDCKQWSCDICTKFFTTKYFLKKHKRLHTGEMPYCCTICNKSFTFQQSFHKHMLYHSSEKPYGCDECGRAFKEHSTLQNHARIHSGERPFSCEICDKLEILAPVTEKQNQSSVVPCLECKKSFATLGNLRLHVKRQHPGKRFRQRVSYLVHMRIHTGVMPYKCTACNKSFRYKVSQRSHKCPMSPPGTVIEITESDALSLPNIILNKNKSVLLNHQFDNSTAILLQHPKLQNVTSKEDKCILTVDYDTGNINLIPKNALRTNKTYNIHKSYPETCNLKLTWNSGKYDEDKLINTCSNKGNLVNEEDMYSMVLSPILSEVESLCLNNSSLVKESILSVEENVNLIQEKCLEELFQ